MYEPYNPKTASVNDRVAWTLCQIIDDDAPMRWTRYRFAAECIAGNVALMADLAAMAKAPKTAESMARHATGTVADIPDDELLIRAVAHAARGKGRKPAWSKVSDAFALGSTYAHQLCRRFGIDPDTGNDVANTPAQEGEPR